MNASPEAKTKRKKKYFKSIEKEKTPKCNTVINKKKIIGDFYRKLEWGI